MGGLVVEHCKPAHTTNTADPEDWVTTLFPSDLVPTLLQFVVRWTFNNLPEHFTIVVIYATNCNHVMGPHCVVTRFPDLVMSVVWIGRLLQEMTTKQT